MVAGQKSRKSLRDVLRSAVGDSLESTFVMHALRQFKRREILRVAYGDIVKQQRLETVIDQISAIAECVIDEALRVAMLQQENCEVLLVQEMGRGQQLQY